MIKKVNTFLKVLKIFKKYINTASLLALSAGQKLWLDYIKPYIDTHIIAPMVL